MRTARQFDADNKICTIAIVNREQEKIKSFDFIDYLISFNYYFVGN